MLGYVGAVGRAAGARELHLIHVAPAEQPPPAEGVAVTGRRASTCQVEDLRGLADKHYQGHGGEEIVCQVIEGSPLIEILRYTMEKEIDLVVIGRHGGGDGDADNEATLARRVTQKATCSVLVLPEDIRVKADRIICPVRDSACSANALEMACRVGVAVGGTVVALNVFYVSSGYAAVGTTLEEHTDLLRTMAEEECTRLLARVDVGEAKLETKCVPDLYARPVPIILEEIEKESGDLVVIGARGRTGAAGVLLGHVTEDLIRRSAVPVLAVKKKGECIGVLQALLTLAG